MDSLFFLEAKEAYKKSRTDELANDIWKYKHPDEEINPLDREYITVPPPLTLRQNILTNILQQLI